MLHDINLLNWRRRRQLLNYRRWLGCVVSGVLISVLFQGGMFRSVRHQQHLLTEEQTKRQQERSILEGEKQWWLSQQAQSSQFQHQLMQLDHWERLSRLPYQLMRLLSESTPEGVYFKRLDLREQQVFVQGSGQNAALIAFFLQQLRHHTCGCIRDLKMMSVTSEDAHRGELQQSFQLSFSIVPEAHAKE